MMNASELFQHIDHTLLRPTASWHDMQQHCEQAVRYRAASACIPTSYVARARAQFGDALTICTVVGFPLGYSTTEVKIHEITKAIADGADEIDAVINLGDVKNGDYHRITAEIAAMKQTVGHRMLKVIVEACNLSEAEKIAVCRCVTEGGADYIKTSTGFGSGGATVEDVELFLEFTGANVRVKAAGGIRTRADIERFIAAGCDRVGTSSAVTALAEDAAKMGG